MNRTLVLVCASAFVFTLFAGSTRCQADQVVSIVISPSTINLESEGVWVTVHAEIRFSLVSGISVTLNGLPVEVTKADNRGELVAKFCVDAVKGIVTPGTATLTLSGTTTDGVTFSGTDSIRVVDEGGKR